MGNKNEGYLGGIMGGESRVESGGGLKNTSILSLEEAGTQAVEAAPANKLAGTSILDWTDAGSSYGSSTSTAMVKTGDSWDLLSYDISGFTDGFVCIEMFLPADTAHRAGGIGYSNGATLSSVVGSAVGAAGIRRQIGASVIGQVSTAGFSTTNATFHNYGAHPVVFQLLIECSTGNAWLSYGEAGGATRYWVTGQITRSTSFDYNSPLDASTVITELHAQNYYGGTTSYVNLGADGTFGGQTSDNDTSEWFWDIPAEIAGSGPTETLTLPQLSWGGITGRSVLTEGSAAVPGDDDWDDVTLLLDGSDPTDDLSNTNQDASITNTGSVASASMTGPTGYGTVDALSFDGSNYLTTSHYSASLYNQDFTIEGWFNLPSNPFPTATTNAHLVVHRSTVSEYGLALFVRWSDNSVGLVVGDGTTWVVELTTTGVDFTVGWQHLAATRVGNTYRLFKDGVVIGTATASDTIAVTGDFTLMAGTSAGTNPGPGDVFDFRITEGVARYTSDFDDELPTESFPTSLPVAATPQTLVNTGIFTLEEIYELTKST